MKEMMTMVMMLMMMVVVCLTRTLEPVVGG